MKDKLAGFIGGAALAVAALAIADPAVAAADLALTKSGPMTAVIGGSPATYTVTLTNNGPDPATSVTMTDTLPAGISFVSFNPATSWDICSFVSATKVLTCNNASLASGASVSVVFTFSIDANVANGTVLTNTATASSATADSDMTNNSATASTTAQLVADLAVTKSGPMTAAAGGSATYTVVTTNNGPSTATNVTLSDAFPAGMSFSGFSGATNWDICSTPPSGPISCTDTSLAPGASLTLVYTLSIAANVANGTVLTNTATAASAATDPDVSNNSATASTTAQVSADLSITKTDGVTTAAPGGSVTYTITASNAGPSNVTGANVSDTLPAALTGTWTCVGAGGGTCTAGGNGNINDTVNLPAGGSVTYTVNVTISAAATGTLSNTATVTAPVGATDPTPGNNSATDTDTLAAQADVGVAMTDAPDPQTAGSNVTYTITATNGGPSNAANVAVTFPLPANSTFVSVTMPGANCTSPAVGQGGTVTCTATASMAPASTFVGTVVVNVNSAFAGILTGAATVNSTSTDPNPGNNSATTNTTINPLLLAVSGAASGLGTIACNSPVQYGQTTTCVLTPAQGNLVSSASGCGGTLSGNIFTTGAITAACTVTAVFVPTSIPTLSPWLLAVLAALLALGAAVGVPRRR